MVSTPNLNIEYSMLIQTKICEAIKKDGKRCSTALNVFPPIKDYAEKEISDKIRSNQINGYIVVVYGGGNTIANQIGTITNATANIFQNTISAYSTTIPVTGFSRSDGYSVTLFDVETGGKVLVGGARTSAQGLANITDDVFTSSLASAIVKKMKNERVM